MKYKKKKKNWYNQKLTCSQANPQQKVYSIIKNDGIVALMESDPKGHNF